MPFNRRLLLTFTTFLLFALGAMQAQGFSPEDLISFTSDQHEVQAGDPVSLHWHIEASNHLAIVSAAITPGIGPVASSGSRIVNPTENTQYRLTLNYIDAMGHTHTEERTIEVDVTEDISTLPLILVGEQMLLDADSDERFVKNYNNRLRSITGVKKVNIVRVTHKRRKTPSMQQIKGKVRKLNNFIKTASRGRLSLEINSAVTKQINTLGCGAAKNQAKRGTKRNALVTVYVMPAGVCGFSNAGGGKVFLKSNLFRNYAHEVGHVLGLGHSNRNMPGTGFAGYKDPSSYMGMYPAQSYAISQLHWLGWTERHEVVKINADLKRHGSIEVPLRPINNNAASDSKVPLAYVYDLGDSRLFISIPKGTSSGFNSIKAGEIFIHRAKKGQGCSGICMNSALFGRIAKPFESRDVPVKGVPGMTINPISFKAEKIRVKGKRVNRFTEVTLRITLTDSDATDPEPEVPNDEEEPTGDDPIEYEASLDFEYDGSGRAANPNIYGDVEGTIAYSTVDDRLAFHLDVDNLKPNQLYALESQRNVLAKARSNSKGELEIVGDIGGTRLTPDGHFNLRTMTRKPQRVASTRNDGAHGIQIGS